MDSFPLGRLVEIKDIILHYVKKYPKRFLLHLKQHDTVVNEVENLMNNYSLDFKLSIYWLGRNISPICKYNNIKTYRGFNDDLRFCGLKSKCRCNKESAFKKTKETNVNRYGVENYTNPNKVKKTKAIRYNDSKFNNRHQSRKTCLERYGVENYNNRDKMKNTNFERYGHTSYSSIHISNNVYDKLNDKGWLLEQHHTLEKTLIQIAKELTISDSTVNNYCSKHNIEVKYYSYSYPEKQLVEYIESKYNTKVISNNRSIIKPLELDIYLPEYHLAIEYNGVYWHRPERFGSKEQWIDYHQNKIDLCKEKGIQLLHLWEDYEDHNDLLNNAINNIIDNNLELIFEEIYNKGGLNNAQ